MPKKVTNEQFIKNLKIIAPTIQPLTPYVKAIDKIIVQCCVCNHTWSATPNNLLRGHGCPLCEDKRMSTKMTMSHDEFYRRMALLHPNVDIVGDYNGNQSTMNCTCRIDGFKWSTKASNLLCGKGCHMCKNTKLSLERAKDQHVFESQLLSVNPDIRCIGTYKNSYTKVECVCMVCQHHWFALPNNLLRGRGCPMCRVSKGERLVATTLDDLGITYETQKSFNGCEAKELLRFDFYLPDYNMCIEYDGEQHYHPINFDGDSCDVVLHKYLTGKEYDEIKNTFCRENNISLLRIPYWSKDNIFEILSNNIK